MNHVAKKLIICITVNLFLLTSLVSAGYSLELGVENSIGSKSMLSPQLNLNSALLPTHFTFGCPSNSQQTYFKIKDRLRSIQTAMFSLENAVFVYDEQMNDLKAELVGLRTGGLGRYIGDLLARMTDAQEDVLGVGLLYETVRVQRINEKGLQEIKEKKIDINDLQQRGVLTPVLDENGQTKTIKIEMCKNEFVTAELWIARRTTETGEVYSLLLRQKNIAKVLYVGESSSEERLRQSILLGKGGIKALEEMGLDIDFLHLNEGSAALAGVYARQSKALKDVTISGVMHTPVTAGLPVHDAHLYDKYFFDLPDGWKQIAVDSSNSYIDMTKILFEISGKVAAVSKEFAGVLKNIVQERYNKSKQYVEKIVPITNGVDGWAYRHPLLRRAELQNMLEEGKADSLGEAILMQKHKKIKEKLRGLIRHQLVWYAIGDDWAKIVCKNVERIKNLTNEQARKDELIEKINKTIVPDSDDPLADIFIKIIDEYDISLSIKADVLRSIKSVIRQIEDLVAQGNIDDEVIKEKVKIIFENNGLFIPESVDYEQITEKIAKIEKILDGLAEKLWLSYGRRWTKYKMDYPLLRATGIEQLVKDRQHGGLEYAIIVSGVAHPNDSVGTEWISSAIGLSKKYFGEYIFLPGYDLELDKMLLQAADLWLYSPERLLEACGTSNLAGNFNGTIPVASPTGWSLELLQEFDPQTGKGNGFFIKPYPDPLGDDWREHVTGLRKAKWQGLYDPLKTISNLYYSYRQIYYQLVENVYLDADKGDMILAAGKYKKLMEQSALRMGTYTSPGKTIEEIIQITEDLNFNSIEISFCNSGIKSPDSLDVNWVEQYLKPALVNKFVTIHLADIELNSQESLKNLSKMIIFASNLGAEIVTIHMGELNENFIQYALELVEFAAKYNVKICFENSYFVKEDKIQWHTPLMLNEFNRQLKAQLKKTGKEELTDKFGFVFDVAYAKLAVGNPLVFYDRLDKDLYIAEVNIDGVKKLETSGGDLRLSIQKDEVVRETLNDLVAKLIKERGFNGPFIFELVGDNLSGDKKQLKNSFEGFFSDERVKEMSRMRFVKKHGLREAFLGLESSI